MRDSDWSRKFLLRSDWSGPSVASITTKQLALALNIAVHKQLRGGWGKDLSEGGLCARLKWI